MIHVMFAAFVVTSLASCCTYSANLFGSLATHTNEPCSRVTNDGAFYIELNAGRHKFLHFSPAGTKRRDDCKWKGNVIILGHRVVLMRISRHNFKFWLLVTHLPNIISPINCLAAF